jgi:propanol-preferring alcohol dehydrogenase
MLAIRLRAAGEELRVEEIPLPEPRGAEVRVRVAGCGVCRTDLHIVDGTQPRVELPLTLGHEVAGWIDGAGPEAGAALRRARLRDGDPVVVFGAGGCGSCRQCAGGHEQRCTTGRALGFQRDGGYAEFVLVSRATDLVALGRLDPVRAAPLADAGVTPYRAVKRASPWLVPGARVLLIGFGGLGQFALQYLRRLPELTVAVRELDPGRLELAGTLGADLGILGGDETLVELGLRGPADVVFDLVGADDTFEYAMRNVAAGGLVMLVGEASGEHRFGWERTPIEAWLTTTAWGSRADLGDVVALARRGRLRWDVEPMALRDAAEAHRRVAEGRFGGRLVLVPELAE